MKVKLSNAMGSRDNASGEVSQLKVKETEYLNQIAKLKTDLAGKADAKVKTFAVGDKEKLEKQIKLLQAALDNKQ